MLCTSGSGVGLGLGLSSTFDKAGLGSSLGAGDGRTGGLVQGNSVSGLHERGAAVRQAKGASLLLGLLVRRLVVVLRLLLVVVLVVLLLDSLGHGRSRRGGTGIGSSDCCCAGSHP